MRKSTIEAIVFCANRQLYEAQKLLKEAEPMWNKYMDLKLHEACYMTTFTKEIAGGKVTIELNPEEADSLFDIFCQDAYSFFKDKTFEDLKVYQDFCDIADYIGRTSKFYLTTMHNNSKDKYATALYQIASELLADIELNDAMQIDFDKTMESYDEDYERLTVDLAYIIDGLVEHVESILADVKMVYDYIVDFKQRQKEMFTEYVFSVYND